VVKFLCPVCKASIGAAPLLPDRVLECGHPIRFVEKIPLLFRDYEVLQASIDEAQASSRREWYEAPQSKQFTGPYRHHTKKRRQYVDAAITDFVGGRRDLAGLDLGCGDGSNLPWLSSYVSELYGSDYNLLRLLRAQRQAGVKQLFLADILDYPAADNSFDLIYFNHVLEHIRDDDRALREVFRILKPGGLMVLGVPNEGSAFWQLAYKLQPRIRAITDHVQFYTAESIRQKCIAAGFKVREVHSIGWGVPHWFLDAALRNFKILDDLFEWVGRAVCPGQATSLYVMCGK
jgi:ubiquinone/menaquinone biosynthesis C-methylase UbiE